MTTAGVADAPVGTSTPTIIERRISAGADDVEQRGSKVSLASSDLELVVDGATKQIVGLRFTDLNIPAGAIITSAYVQFQSIEIGLATTLLQIRGLAADDLAAFTSRNNNLSQRPTTTSSAAWQPAPWSTVNEAGFAQRTPDLTAIVQEIVGRSGWQAGYDLGFAISGAGTRIAYAFESDPARAPLLHIEYIMPAANAAPTIDLDGSLEGSGYSTLLAQGSYSIPVVDSDLVIADSDHATLQGLTATISNPQPGDTLTLDGTLPAGITASIGVTTITLTGAASLADYQVAARQLRFTTSTTNLDTTTRQVEVSVTDGQASSNVAVASIAIEPAASVNAAPVLDLDGSASGSGFATLFSGGTAVRIADSDMILSDTDNTTASRATLTLVNPRPGDRLEVSGSLPAGIVRDPSSTATSIILAGTASHAAYRTALQQVVFDNDSPNPDTSARQVEVSVSDGQAWSNQPVATIAFNIAETITLERRISTSADDVEQRGSVMDLVSTDLELVTDGSTVQLVGLRFTDIQVPAGAVVSRAYVQFQADETYAVATSLQLRGLATDDAAPFTTAASDLSSRALTSASSSWSPAAWNLIDEVGPNQRTTDLTAIVQEIIGRSGWQAGNDLGFAISGSGRRTADAYDGGAAKAPLLHIEYSVPQASTIDIVLNQPGPLRENLAGAPVGTLGIADPEQGQTYVFSVADARFHLVGNELRLRDGVRIDFERSPLVNVKITATDGSGGTFVDTVTAIIGDVSETRFAVFGDYGNKSGAWGVAQLVNSLNVDFIVTVGDNVYTLDPLIDGQVGSKYSSYIGNYQGAYGPGSPTNRFFPSLGNHEYAGDGGGVPAYLDYFTLPGNERYYDFVIGPVHFFAVNSNSGELDGNSPTSVQGQWLKAGLAASTSPYDIVYFHHAPFTSGAHHGSTETMQWPFEQWGATAVLAGHEHLYERILRDDDGNGNYLPYFVTGLGGATPVGFGAPIEGSQTRFNADFGTMLVQASDESITFEFIAVTGGPVIDSFTIDLPPAAIQAAGDPVREIAPTFERADDPSTLQDAASIDYFA